MTTTWKDGDALKYEGSSHTEPVVPGLFWYSGFGMGRLYLPDNTVAWTNSSAAAERCAALGIPFKWRDVLRDYTATALGDR